MFRLPEVTVRIDESRTSARSTAQSFDIRRRSFCLLVAMEGPTGKSVPLLVLRADLDERDALLSTGHPFFAPRAGPGRVGVLLTVETDWEEIRVLVTGATGSSRQGSSPRCSTKARWSVAGAVLETPLLGAMSPEYARPGHDAGDRAAEFHAVATFRSSRNHRDRLDGDEQMTWEDYDGRGSRRRVNREVLGVEAVRGPTIVQISEEGRRLDYVLQATTGRLQDGLKILKRLSPLGLEATRYCLGRVRIG